MKVSPVRPVGVREIECKRRCSHRLIASIGLQVRLRDKSPKKERHHEGVSLFLVTRTGIEPMFPP